MTYRDQIKFSDIFVFKNGKKRPPEAPSCELWMRIASVIEYFRKGDDLRGVQAIDYFPVNPTVKRLGGCKKLQMRPN